MFKSNLKSLTVVACLLAGFIAPSLTALADESLTADQYYDRGCQEAGRAEYQAAIADYDRAIAKNPQHWKAYGNRGAARFNVHDYQGALDDYNTAIANVPPNEALNNCKRQAEEAIASNQNAEAARRRANMMLMNAQLGGDFADPSTIIMMNAQRRGLIPSDNPVVPIARPLAPASIGDSSSKNSPFAHGTRGGSEFTTQADGTGPFADSSGSSPFADADQSASKGMDASAPVAIQSQQLAVQSQQSAPQASGSAQSHFDRGCERGAVNDWPGAIKEYDQAIAIDPNMGKAYANRGSARFNSQNYQGALDDFDNAVRLMPDNPAVKALRDQIARTLGK
jgi:tetratricopeptide (TPR) repeat protein